MEPHEHDEGPPHTHTSEHDNTNELKQYLQHNLKHLEDHIKSFSKLQGKIEDTHALESLKAAINHLQKGADELKHILHHL